MKNLSTSNLSKNINENFLTALKNLYEQIENFNKNLGLNTKYIDIDIYEEAVGQYKAKALHTYDGENFLFEIKPIGAYIIGAEGRADFIGTLDKKVLIYLEKQHYLVIKTGERNKEVSSSNTKLYEGFESPGWYISLEKKKVALLNKKNFCWLLEDVSDYKCPQ